MTTSLESHDELHMNFVAESSNKTWFFFSYGVDDLDAEGPGRRDEDGRGALPNGCPGPILLYTGNEGMESGYIYTSAVIMLGESCIGDY